MKSAALAIKVVLDSEEPERMKLVFEEVVAQRNITLFNAPGQMGFEAIEKYCAPVIWAIVVRWVDPKAGIPGIQAIELKRHTVTVVKADQHVFEWKAILEQLYLAIREAYDGRWVTMEVNEEETVNQLVDYVIESQRLKSWLGLSPDADLTETWTVCA